DGTFTIYPLTVIRQVPVNFTFSTATGIAVTAASYTASGNTANLTLNFWPPPGTTLTIVNNTGTTPIQGVFDNLAQGQRVELTYNGITYAFVVNYTGGTGNDLVLQWSDTRLFAWGNNGYGGQLGNNNSTDSLVEVPVIASGVLAGKTVIAVASGDYHNLALCADGSLAAWGNNDYGQLGDYTSNSQAVPVAVEQMGVLAGKRVTAIAAGGSRSVALCDDGTIADWGQGYYGQLGYGGTSQQQAAPTLVARNGVLAGKIVTTVAAGGSHTIVLCSDGTLAGWGSNSNGQLGAGSTTDSSVPLLVNRTGVLAGKTVTTIATGASHSLALCSDGTLAAWGYNSYGQLGDGSSANRSLPVAVDRTGVLSGKSITGIACGGAFSLVLCSDGTLAAWGGNSSGQLGNGTTTSSLLPVLVTRSGVLSGKTVVAVSAGYAHGLARCSDGNLAAWGYNSNGQLGNATTTNSTLPVWVSKNPLTSGENFTAAVGGLYHSLALIASPPPPRATTLAATGVLDTAATLQGSVTAQGGAVPVSFQFGLTSAYGTTLAAAPATVTGSTATTVAASASGLLSGTTYHYRVVAATVGRTVTGSDQTFTTTTLATLVSLGSSGGMLSPAFASITTSYFATVPFATTSFTLTPACDNPAAIIQVNGAAVASGAASGPITLAVGTNPVNTVVSAGSNEITYTLTMTRLPQAITFNSATDVPVMAANFAASGAAPGIALTFAPAPGTNLMVVNNTGRNSIQGTFANLVQWQPVNLTFNGVTYPFVANYFGGTGNDLVLQWANTRLLAWGSGYGPLPVDLGNLLAGKTVNMIDSAGSHSLALCTDGTVATWISNSSVPMWVDGTGVLAGKTVVSVAAGANQDLALCSDGTVVTWSASGGVPVAVDQTGVLAGKAVIALAGGVGHSLALCADGTLAVWGGNGQLGNGDLTSSSVPVLVDQTGVLAGKTVTAIGAGAYHSVGLCSDGSMVAWGWGGDGELGNGSSNQSPVPVLVSQTGVLAGKVAVAISVGNMHTLALCADGTAVAWGYNSYGELGNNSTSNSNVPVRVTQTGVLAGKTVVAVAAATGGSSSNGSYGMHSLALCADGTVAAWGFNGYGQLGSTTPSYSSVPILVSNSSLAAGERMVAVAGDGSSHCLAMVVSPPIAVVTTLAATATSDTGATLNGSVNAQGSAAATSFEYGLTSSYGSSIVASPASVGGSTATAVRATVSGLLAGATYHYRAVTASGGYTPKGADLTFTTTVLATLADLTLSSGTLTPSYSANITGYFTTVPFATTSINVTPRVTTPGATVTVAGVPVDSGTAGNPLDLMQGNNPLAIVVTAADGMSARTYTVTVIRLPEAFIFNSATDVPLTVGAFLASGSVGDLVLHYAPTPGADLMVVKNTGRNAIQGSFDNLVQGQSVNLTYQGVAYPFVVSYFGGTGNDLVLQWANTRLMAWGSNGNGQLGNNTTTNSSVAVPVDMTGVLVRKTIIAVATGDSHNLALCSDGTLAAMGFNYYGQCGNNSTINNIVPVLVDQTGVFAGKMVVAISAAGGHSLALCSDGTLGSWGWNFYGQLGNSSTTDSKVPTPVNATGVLLGRRVVAVAAGGTHSLALCADGALVAWGSNSYGQLGNDSSAGSSVPVLVNQSGVLAGRTVIAVAAGLYHCLALCADGSVAAWGYNLSGQLGNNSTTNSNVPVWVENTAALAGKTVTAIRTVSSQCMGLCSDGTLVAWGNNTTPTSSVPVLLSQSGVLAGKSVVGITCGSAHSLAVCSDGNVAAWGFNSSGQLGNNSTNQSSVPVWVDPNGLRTGEYFAAASGGLSHNLALVASPPPPVIATLAAAGILDTGATLTGNLNANGSTTTTVSFEYGLTSSYGSTTTGSPASVSGTTTTTAEANLSGLLAGSIYHYRVVASSGGGTVVGEDMTFTTTTFASLAGLALSRGTVYPSFASINTRYIATVPFATDRITVLPVAAYASATLQVNGVALAAGAAGGAVDLIVGNNVIATVITSEDGISIQTYTVIVTRLPEVFTFDTATDVPVAVSGFVATGSTPGFALNHAPAPGACLTVIHNTGSGPIQGTFDNLAQGQLVQLTHEGISYSFAANYFGGAGNDLLLQWANTGLLAWGYNYDGQLGNNSTTNSSVATPVAMSGVLVGKTVVTTAAGDSHGLALCLDGTLAAWGNNSNGQLGNNSTTDGNAPLLVDRTGVLSGKTVVGISAGSYHSLALCSDGSVAAWGVNSYAQLGDNTTTSRKVPVLVSGMGVLMGKRVVAISAGFSHTLALCSDGTLVAWGYNSYGQLGNNGTISSIALVPVMVDRSGVLSGKTIAAIAAGASHSLALCTDGTLAAWGYNAYGQLGNNSTTLSSVPVLVDRSGMLSGKVVTAITAGTAHSMALCSDGTLAAWGQNGFGQLGNNSTANSKVPVLVDRTGALIGKTIAAISAGTSHSLAWCSDGSLAAWGYDNYGQLGNNSTTSSSVPVAVNTDGFVPGTRCLEAAGGTSHSLALVALPLSAATPRSATAISGLSATLNGSVNAEGNATTVTFEYGLSAAYDH
ncbi:MAG: cadherin-like beta sandwich domain-containing protein, partial [Verrucomicrobiota bacterium]